jgi:hypothetical protein
MELGSTAVIANMYSSRQELVEALGILRVDQYCMPETLRVDNLHT